MVASTALTAGCNGRRRAVGGGRQVAGGGGCEDGRGGQAAGSSGNDGSWCRWSTGVGGKRRRRPVIIDGGEQCQCVLCSLAFSNFI
jgi:hypothetical protein